MNIIYKFSSRSVSGLSVRILTGDKQVLMLYQQSRALDLSGLIHVRAAAGVEV